MKHPSHRLIIIFGFDRFPKQNAVDKIGLREKEIFFCNNFFHAHFESKPLPQEQENRTHPILPSVGYQ